MISGVGGGMGSAFRHYNCYLVIDNEKQFQNGAAEYMKDERIVGLSGGNSNHNSNQTNGANGALNAQSVQPTTNSHCNGCRELKREIDDLRRLVSHIIDPRTDASQTQATRPPSDIARLQQPEMSLHHINTSCSPQLLPWLISNGLSSSSPTTSTIKLLENLEAARNANQTTLSTLWSALQNGAAVPTSSSAASNSLIPEMNHAVTASLNSSNIQTHGNSYTDHQVVMDSSETSSSPSSTNTQLVLVSPQQQLRQPNILNGSPRDVLDSVVSQLNSNAVTQLFNITNGANVTLQQQIASLFQIPKQELPMQVQQSILLSNGAAALQQQQRQQLAQQQLAQQQQQRAQQHLPNITTGRPAIGAAHITTERGPPCNERRIHSGFQRAASDDYVRIIRHQDLSEENVNKIQIPVKEALQIDPNFRPLGEQQVIQQVMQNKKYDSVNVSETMAQLCKKLAEKRVFGSRLMAQTTVAAPNHSNYNNLPNDGIIYIQNVCRKVLGDRVESDEEFWECFREAMRKLAARCRRVRHAKKVRSPKVEDIFNHHRSNQSQMDTSAFLLSQQNLLQQQQIQKTQHQNQQSMLLNMEVESASMVDVQQSNSPPESQTFSSPSRNSSTPTPSSSSKQDN